MNRRAGFTLIETAVALVVVSLVVLIGFPKVSGAMARNDVRAARTMMVNMVAKARAASTEASRRTWLKVSGNRAWIVATPRRNPPVIPANTVDTLGIVENLNARYNATVTLSGDSIGFDPRGIASWVGGNPTITITRKSYTDVVTVDGMGRVLK